MTIDLPRRLFLDTNIYIIGALQPNSPHAAILRQIGFFEPQELAVSEVSEVIVSDVLLEQILRVGRRIQDKDYSGALIAQLWRNLTVRYVTIDREEMQALYEARRIPSEDIAIYLSAVAGGAECFVSANRKLIRALVEETNAFECLTPQEFSDKYLAQ
jgi:predicted nucleic acid-binding protein